jgi:hypothetical protein
MNRGERESQRRVDFPAFRPMRMTNANQTASPSSGTKRFIDAHAAISVPSTVKWSLEVSFLHFAQASALPKNSRITASENSRSRFSPKLVAAHTAIQQVVLDMLNQLPLGTDGKQNLQQVGAQKPLQWKCLGTRCGNTLA